jgi:hypothetical protein
MERFLGLWEIVELDKTLPESRPCVPILWVTLSDPLEDWHSLTAAPVVGQSGGQLAREHLRGFEPPERCGAQVAGRL